MENERLFERILDKREVFAGPLIKVEHWRVGLYGGGEALREIVRHVGAAAVVPVDENGVVTLVTQFRVAMGRVMLEVPAGKKDGPDEDPLVCARRELSEETGLSAENWRHLTTLDTSPGFLTERIGLYLATGLTQGDSHPDEGEYLGLVRMPLDEAVQKITEGQITDGKTIAGLLLAKEALRRAR